MKFNFKIQQFQTDAVEAIAAVFSGQRHHSGISYRHDPGLSIENRQLRLTGAGVESEDFNLETGYRNAEIELSDENLLKNIRSIQARSNIKLSEKLSKEYGRCVLDIEMETGTGKTYVYIKTIFELNKRFGWSKFIVVVPSIAIREGVRKSFEMTIDHFMEHYGKKARFFVYDSSNLNQLDQFSSSFEINVMIINTQAFASSLKEDGRSKDSRIIYSKRDEFGSRRPIDVIQANRPILILDEPQKMGGQVTRNSLQNFNPLFALNFSATHATVHNPVYVLDALDAYRKRLVKKIEVKGFEVKNLTGANGYLYLQEIIVSSSNPPRARIEFEKRGQTSIRRETRIINFGDDLHALSHALDQYKGFVVSEIDPIRNRLTFTNGIELVPGEVVGDVSEKNVRRIQIRETILSHFEKEENLFNQGIKTLSLFFIDEVAKYRHTDNKGNETPDDYGMIFEQEYESILREYVNDSDTPYQRYLKERCSNVSAVHKGYFSIDSKTGRSVDSVPKRGADFSDDISAYALILKNKERLLSFDEPTRFIFSHSALREGWDNPNVFQICTLKNSDSNVARHQEVGRGLRLCVDQNGYRMDAESCGETVHDINLLTVIASESYRAFVSGLQENVKEALYDRPTKASADYFKGKFINIDGKQEIIDEKILGVITHYLSSNGYVDYDQNITDKYRTDIAMNTVAELPESYRAMSEGIHQLVQAIYDENVLSEMFSNGLETKIKNNPLNQNFAKQEFQELWRRINHKYSYTVNFDSQELIRKSIAEINAKLNIAEVQYTMTSGRQKFEISEHLIGQGESFEVETSQTRVMKNSEASQIKYDLVGKVAAGTILTRRTVAAILREIRPDKLVMFRLNPEEFIRLVTHYIKEQKATMIVEHISYNQIDGEYDSTIFTADKSSQSFEKAFQAKKAIQDYVFTDGIAENSVERRFAKELDAAKEVSVYTKLPRGFHIPTPVGNYSPDWAIAFHKGTVKHIFFIAETKGSMQSMELRPIEKAKISCAKKLFNELSTNEVKYHEVDSYQSLLNVMNSL